MEGSAHQQSRWPVWSRHLRDRRLPLAAPLLRLLHRNPLRLSVGPSRDKICASPPRRFFPPMTPLTDTRKRQAQLASWPTSSSSIISSNPSSTPSSSGATGTPSPTTASAPSTPEPKKTSSTSLLREGRSCSRAGLMQRGWMRSGRRWPGTYGARSRCLRYGHYSLASFSK